MHDGNLQRNLWNRRNPSGNSERKQKMKKNAMEINFLFFWKNFKKIDSY